jgi:hypothetical protein
MEGTRKFLVMLVLAGALMLSFGCGGDGDQLPPPEPAPAEGNGTGEVVPVVEENETGCLDGTPFGNCSITKPKFCDESGNLINDVEACGCPDGTFRRGNECLDSCEDGTLLGECSPEQPGYCNMSAEIEELSSLCGCPGGYDRDGEGCRNTCDDGTPKLICSDATPPYYCNADYELVINPILCGCFEWEFRIVGECFDPTAQEYGNEDVVRVTEDVNLVIDKVEELHCDDSNYIKLRLTISNGGDEAFSLGENDVRMYREDRYRLFSARPQGGCSVANVYNWADVPAGQTKAGNIYFKLVGGVGDYYNLQVSRLYYGDTIRSFNFTLTTE